MYVYGVLAVLLLSLSIWGLWQKAVRISHVSIYGADQSLSSLATEAMQGSYLGIIPHDSFFFVSESRIRAAILAANPDIAAVSIFRDGFNGLSVKVDYRVPVARWCGGPENLSFGTTTQAAAICYDFDASGFLYVPGASDSAPLNTFTVYEALMGTTTPVGAVLPHATQFPDAFDFARNLINFGSSVRTVVFRGDEVDDYLASGTRVTYVLGGEQDAYAALVSARADLNLSDGSIAYVDLRFPGKVYLKRNK